ncbi:hypothetical protein PV08_09357 [Exophiala spinifera]|uniref:Luciferase domain-containing protein n=1 Tax=Exophiala spinifera TaxID=91928 RepID=A0A0D2AZG6_9EURO|nr:uncharacterized protein PV08_09357 [Exophiala spinifera]KIW12083.1 hypothetical protein PV08_09357 [Exophiala spinifera]
MSTSTLQSQYSQVMDTIRSRPTNAALTSTAVAAVALFTAWVVSDFHAWKSFGTGGTPPTWSGYWGMTKLRVGRMLSGDDLSDASGLSSAAGPSYLDADAVPVRAGPRPPIVSRTMPQRQVPYGAGVVAPGVADRTATLPATFAARYPDILDVRPSRTEGYSSDGIYARESLPTVNAECGRQKFIGTEVAHVHPADGSLHVWLSEPDAKTVVEKGWAQRFPLAFIPKGWVMVYAPRTMEEVDVVEGIIKAGVAWVSGVTTVLT